MLSFNVDDDPEQIYQIFDNNVFKHPMLININTNRKYWHAGAGIDDENVFDRYKDEIDSLGVEAELIHKENKKIVEDLWQRQLEIQ